MPEECASSSIVATSPARSSFYISAAHMGCRHIGENTRHPKIVGGRASRSRGPGGGRRHTGSRRRRRRLLGADVCLIDAVPQPKYCLVTTNAIGRRVRVRSAPLAHNEEKHNVAL